jgi:hypothetical protein
LASLWGAINSLQILCLLPFNRVSFTNELYFFFAILVNVTGFDIYSPWDYDDLFQSSFGRHPDDVFGYTKTDVYSDEFAWMTLDSCNYMRNMGWPGFILVFLLVSVAVQPLFWYCSKRGYKGPGRVFERSYRDNDDLIGTIIRFTHELFLNFILLGAIVVLMLNLTRPTSGDLFSLSIGLFILPFALVYPLFISYFGFV